MNYLIKRRNRYYYNRRVPQELSAFDTRGVVRVSLKTDCQKQALKLAMAHDSRLENYWNNLAMSGSKHSETHYKAVVERASLLGFPFYPMDVISGLSDDQLYTRLSHVQEHFNEKHVEAVLGGVKQPIIHLAEVLDRFWSYSKDKLLNKSPNQIRKWKNPRIKAMRNFIACIGNKPVKMLTRDDSLSFRDWWIVRIDKEGLNSGSANKDLIYVKMLVSTVVENMKIDLDTNHIFRKLIITLDDAKKRLPFTTDYLQTKLLLHDNFKGLNDQAKWALFAFAETGAGLAELTGLNKNDIMLDHEIPHIIIRPEQKKALKTKFRTRTIPLVGFALDAFLACPNGFPNYRDRADTLSATLGKFLSENKLLPSDQHTVYSLRHSFQDRLLAANAPDRVQADLMGHKFNRPSYGDGSTFELKLEWLKRICLKTPVVL